MIGYPYGALATGIAFIIGAVALLIRYYMLDKSQHYPDAPKTLLSIVWGYGMFIFFGGLYFVSVYIFGKPNTVPPQPTDFEQAVALAIMIMETALCINMVRQRLTDGMWSNIKLKLKAYFKIKD